MSKMPKNMSNSALSVILIHTFGVNTFISLFTFGALFANFSTWKQMSPNLVTSNFKDSILYLIHSCQCPCSPTHLLTMPSAFNILHNVTTSLTSKCFLPPFLSIFIQRPFKNSENCHFLLINIGQSCIQYN